MSSPGRYQSRFFSLLSRQSLRLRDRYHRAVRQAQVAIAWGAQIVLYPVYALFQTTRLIGKQVQQVIRQIAPQLRAAEQTISRATHPSHSQPAITADTPLQNTLKALHTFALPASINLPMGLLTSQVETSIVSDPGSPLVTHLATNGAIANLTVGEQNSVVEVPRSLSLVRGIATLLENRALVLVTDQNQVLDILTEEQQARLQQRIIWEVATYWRHQRVLQSGQPSPDVFQGESPFFLPLLPERKNLLPPVRLFYRLIGWMQTGPVALATNLFQESSLVLYALGAEMAEAAIALPASQPGSPPQFNAAQPNAAQLNAPPADHFKSSTAEPTSSLNDWANRVRVMQKMAVEPGTRKPKAGRRQPVQPKHGIPNSIQTTAQNAANALTFSTDPASELVKVTNSALSELPKEPQSRLAHLPPYIETKATLVGYVKHPLEQLLEWLDLGMLWLEKNLSRTWRWMRQRWGA